MLQGDPQRVPSQSWRMLVCLEAEASPSRQEQPGRLRTLRRRSSGAGWQHFQPFSTLRVAASGRPRRPQALFVLTACKRGDLQSIKVLYMVVVWCVNDISHGQHRENAGRTAESVTQDAISRPSGFFGLIIVIGPYRIEIWNIDIVSISYRISNVFSTVSYRIDFQFDRQH